MSSASSDRKQLDMDPSKDQSRADKKATRDDKGWMVDTPVPVQDIGGSDSLSPGRFTSNSNHSLGHATNRWHNVAVQNMASIGDSDRAGKQPRNIIHHSVVGAAHTFGNAIGLGHKNNTSAGGNLGDLGEPYNILGHQDAPVQNGSVAGAIGIPGMGLQALPGHGAPHIQGIHKDSSAARSLNKIQRIDNDAGGENTMSSRDLEGIPRAQNLRNGPPKTCFPNREHQGNVSHPPNVQSTGAEVRLPPWVAWNAYDANKDVPAALDAYNDPSYGYEAGGETQLPHGGLLAAQSVHDSQGNVLLGQGLHKGSLNDSPARQFCYDPANIYIARGQSQRNHSSHTNSPAAQYHYDTPPDVCDAQEHGHQPPQRSVLAQCVNDDPKNILTTRILHNVPRNVCGAEGYGNLAPRNLCDAQSNIFGPRNFRRSALPNVCDELSHPFIKPGSSDRFPRCLPSFHNSSVTSTSSVSADTIAVQRYHHTCNNNSSNNNNNVSATAPGFVSPASSSVFGSNAPSVGTAPYVAITRPSSTHLSRNNTNNNVALIQQLEPFADPSPPISTASSSSKTCTATMFPPSGIVISDADMERAMAYCYDRGNGQYTRLVPVDVLPFSLRDLPARVTSDDGMIVLPVPRMVSPDGQPANVQLIPHVAGSNVTPPISPTGPIQGGSNDLIQNRIDNIVAAAPSATTGPVILARSASTANCSGRREKVYCDKWIHDGTCAFTQQGCKFKHDMPMDKETQQSLGLFHGLPAWYRKQEAERVMHLDDRPVPLGGGAVAYYGAPTGGRFGNNGGAFGAGAGTASRVQNWRRIEAAPPASAATNNDDGSSPLSGGSGSRGGAYGRGRNGTRVANYRANNNFGPIGPPSQSTSALGFGGNRRRTNTLASGDMFSTGGPSTREAQRDDAAPRGGVRIASNPFGALADYGCASNTSSDKGKGSEKGSDYTEEPGHNEAAK